MTRHVRSHRRRRGTTVAVALLATTLAVGAALIGADAPTVDDPAEGGSVPVAVPSGTQAPDRSPAPSPTPTPTPPADAVLTVVAAGDVLPHQPVIASARTDAGGYDFTPLLEPMRPWVEGADLALCHLEVPVAPAGTSPSGYPVFGAPAEIVTGLRATGWDGCSTASNHSLDRGAAGVTATLDALDANGLGHVGTARSPEAAATPQLYELVREGRTVRVAHLAATYGTNGMPIPASAPWSVTLIDTAALVQQATAARAAGADLVLVSVHCCVEYVSAPTAEQERIAAELATSGQVDLLIGHHAHVPQPVQRVPGGPGGTGMWVAHGLGNMLSNQDADCCSARTDSGLLLTATARVPAEGPATVEAVTWTALTVDRRGGHRVHPLPSTATTATVGTLGPDELVARLGRVQEVVGADAPERTAPPSPTGPPPTVLPRP